jgi:hypothetical protein
VHFAHVARLDVVDEAAHVVAVRQKRMLAYPRDRPAHRGVDVGKRAELYGGSAPVSAAISARKAPSSVPCRPQFVWCISRMSRVCIRRCETTSERSMSSVISPPALRRMCACPESRPKIRNMSMRESMQVTMATCMAGMTARGPAKPLSLLRAPATRASIVSTRARATRSSG